MNNRSWITTVRLSPPSLRNNTADADRMLAALKIVLDTDAVSMPLALARRLPALLREWHYQAACVLFCEENRWQVVTVWPPDAPPPLGLALDLGTSRVVLRLVDLDSGETLGERDFDNPQITVGPDVLARIHYCDQAVDGRERLMRLVVDAINDQLAELAASCRRRQDEIALASVAGNTAMTHLLLGLDPHWLIREPYIPVVNRPGVQQAADLGFRLHPDAVVKVFPNIGSYFGGDLIAGILCSGIDRSEETAILVDVGTNAEVVFGNSHWLIACAGAAGPALEGGVTRMGMMASPGVIDRVRIDAGSGAIHLHTIAEKAPVGICGSGLIDLAAQLYLAGMIDLRGRLVPGRCGARFLTIDGISHLMIADAAETAAGEALTISQADLDSLVRSKAAMYTILETLTAAVEMVPADIETFYVAGTFGAYIDPVSAITVGMLPDLPVERYRSLGNTSLEGAARLLADRTLVNEVDRIRDRITYLELNVNQEFMNRFSAAKFIPHTNPALFPSVTRSVGGEP